MNGLKCFPSNVNVKKYFLYQWNFKLSDQFISHTLSVICGMGNYKEECPVIMTWQRVPGLMPPWGKEGCRVFQSTAILRGFISLWNHTSLYQNSSADQMCLNRLSLSKVACKKTQVPSEQETGCESAFDNPHFWSIRVECTLIWDDSTRCKTSTSQHHSRAVETWVGIQRDETMNVQQE